MNFSESTVDWISSNIAPLLEKNYTITKKSVKNDDFGDCEGINFDSVTKTGYVYFWSTGMMSFGLYDLKNNISIVEMELIEIKNISDATVLLGELAKYL